HLHIVTTNIRHTGDRIPDHFIGQRLIQPARKAIEQEYHLARSTPEKLKQHNPEHKLQYGHEPTLQAMSDTIRFVMENYHYRSLSEFNAALKPYNIRLHNGRPGGRIHQHHGLLYQITDELGQPMNAPIKASALPSKPTFKNLEKHFTAGRSLDPASANYIRYVLDQAIRERPDSAVDFQQRLHARGVETAHPAKDRETAPEIFFVNLLEKRVLTTADLGPNYSPSAIADRLGFDPFKKITREKSLDHSLQPELTREKSLDHSLQPGLTRERQISQRPGHYPR
ncbi:MAG TPA: hypothetical protein VG605_01375, partial [Puia sp.]|nr:hypothetical protein [Puia sp.]